MSFSFVRACRLPIIGTVLTLGAFIAPQALATECEIGHIWLQSQSAIDQFQGEHGDGQVCTDVTGHIVVEQDPDGVSASERITSLAGLADILEINGSLTIIGNPHLESLAGLEGLLRVSESLRIAHNRSLRSTASMSSLIVSPSVLIDHNRVLLDVAGLSRFRGEYRGLDVQLIANPSLVSLEGLNGLWGTVARLRIQENHALKSLDGIERLTGTQWGLHLEFNNNLEDISALSGFSGAIGGLEIEGNPKIRNLDALAGATGVQRLLINDNDGLEDINGLAGVKGRISTIRFLRNPLLSDIDGLAGLTGSFDIWIAENENLENVDGLAGIRSAQYWVHIKDNPNLRNLDGLASLELIHGWYSALEYIGELVVTGNTRLTDCAGLGRVLGYPAIPHDPGSDSVASDVRIGASNGVGARSADDCLETYAERLPPTLPDFDLAVHGSWYDPAISRQGAMMFTAPNGTISIYYYTYDESGAPEWFVAFSPEGPRGWNEPVQFTVYALDGGGFTAFDPDLVDVDSWGTATLRLWDCRGGRLDFFGPGGDERSLQLQRLGTVLGSPCNDHAGINQEPPGPGLVPVSGQSLTGAWFDRSTSGQGFSFHLVSTERGVVYFYGFRDDGTDLWLYGEWNEALSFGEEQAIPMLEFERYVNPEDGSSTGSGPIEWGTLSLRIDDCRSGFAILDGEDGVQTLDLQLIAGAVGLPCRTEQD